jgi:flagellar hook-associated protein 1 FlgK
MTTFNEILSIGRSGLQSARSMLNMAGYNIANAETPGFSRRTARLVSHSILGMGVESLGPVAIRNEILNRNLLVSYGEKGFHESQLQSLSILETVLNDLDGQGVISHLMMFEESLEKLSANPSSLPLRQGVLAAAEDLASTFKATWDQIDRTKKLTKQHAESLAKEINLKSNDIASLNHAIRSLLDNQQDASSLIDQRTAVLADLAKLIDVNAIAQDDGTVLVFSAGQPLVGKEHTSTVRIFEEAIPIDATTTDPQEGTSVIGLEFIIGGIDPDAPPDINGDGVQNNADLAAFVKRSKNEIGGEVGGVLSSYNEVLEPTRKRLDEVAYGYATEFNIRHQDGYNLDDPQVTGFDFWDAPITFPNINGFAQSLQLSVDVEGIPENVAAAADDGTGVGEGPGGNGNLTNNGLTKLSMFADIVKAVHLPATAAGIDARTALEDTLFLVAEATHRAQMGVETEGTTVIHLETLLQSETGVSIDEELIAMTQANKAFEAASAVIRATEKMSQTLMGLVG